MNNIIIIKSCKTLAKLYVEVLKFMLHFIIQTSSRRMRWAGCAARIGSMTHTEFCSEGLNGRDYVGYLNVDGRMILNWIVIN
jgi:hypothetical protein